LKNICPECDSHHLDFESNIYKCRNCGASFDVPAKKGFIRGSVIRTIIAIFSVIVITFVLFRLFVLASSSVAMKPAIYLYTSKEEKENLKLKVKGKITTRIPW